MEHFSKALNTTRSASFYGLLALVAAFQCGPAAQAEQGPAPKNPPARLNVQDTPINRDGKAPISFAPVAKKVGPSVVNIYSTMTNSKHK